MYRRNGLKFGQTTVINGAVYDISWFPKASQAQLDKLGVSHVDDPIIPDLTLFTYTENPDGTINEIPIPPAVLEGPNLRRIKEGTAYNIKGLWQAAHDYEYEEISGTAIGLLVLGVIQNKPKALAVQAWSKSIWTLYYIRKAAVTEIYDPSLLNFSSCGKIPHSIPELMAELGI